MMIGIMKHFILAVLFSRAVVFVLAWKDCSEHYNAGSNIDGVYNITPIGFSTPFQVYCEMSTGSWTRIQRREDGHVNFFRNYSDYQAGFGVLTEEHWLGNEHIYALTKQPQYKLRIDFTLDNGTELYAEYSSFSINSQSDGYRLNVTGFSGTVKGDSLAYHNGQTFSTYDNGASSGCAVTYHGGWWYLTCHGSNLNGQFRYNRTCNIANMTGAYAAQCVSWNYLLGIATFDNPIRKVTMKVKDVSLTELPLLPMNAPSIQIKLTGEILSENKEAIPEECANEYMVSLTTNSLAMEETMQALLKTELCSGRSGITVSHGNTTITVAEAQSTAHAAIHFKQQGGGQTFTIDNHQQCANAIGRYMQDHAHWFRPLIDVIPHFPTAYFPKDMFNLTLSWCY